MFRRHPALAIVIGLALAYFGAMGAAAGAKLTVPYVIIVGGGALFVGAVDRTANFSRVALVGLAIWGVGHLTPTCSAAPSPASSPLAERPSRDSLHQISLKWPGRGCSRWI